jgi:hypothetical protein
MWVRSERGGHVRDVAKLRSFRTPRVGGGSPIVAFEPSLNVSLAVDHGSTDLFEGRAEARHTQFRQIGRGKTGEFRDRFGSHHASVRGGGVRHARNSFAWSAMPKLRLPNARQGDVRKFMMRSRTPMKTQRFLPMKICEIRPSCWNALASILSKQEQKIAALSVSAKRRC